MPTRSYDQYCPIAYTLDVVGDRWTLLILRELLYGPRRYSDLLRSLPGLSTNLLADRLQTLESEKLLEKLRLPPPSGSAVYALTERGRALKPVFAALTQCGLPYLGWPPPEQDFVGLSPVMIALELRGRRLIQDAEFRVGDDVFHVAPEFGGTRVGYGPLEQPDLLVKADPETLLGIIFGRLDVAVAIDQGRLQLLRGDPRGLARILE